MVFSRTRSNMPEGSPDLLPSLPVSNRESASASPSRSRTPTIKPDGTKAMLTSLSHQGMLRRQARLVWLPDGKVPFSTRQHGDALSRSRLSYSMNGHPHRRQRSSALNVCKCVYWVRQFRARRLSRPYRLVAREIFCLRARSSCRLR